MPRGIRVDRGPRCMWSARKHCGRPAVGVATNPGGLANLPICLPCADRRGIPIQPYTTGAVK